MVGGGRGRVTVRRRWRVKTGHMVDSSLRSGLTGVSVVRVIILRELQTRIRSRASLNTDITEQRDTSPGQT